MPEALHLCLTRMIMEYWSLIASAFVLLFPLSVSPSVDNYDAALWTPTNFPQHADLSLVEELQIFKEMPLLIAPGITGYNKDFNEMYFYISYFLCL